MAVQSNKAVTTTGQGSSKGAVGSVGIVRGPCYNCDQPSHFSRFYPYPPKKKQQTYTTRVHSTTVDEIPKGEPVTADKFPINQHPAVVLFDSESSHSFMSQTFARKHEQLCTELGYGYRISSAGANVLTNQMVSSELDSYAWTSSGRHYRDELDEGLGSSYRYRESGTYP
jgi:hypothetical protein